ncbi:MAG: lytic transglycosylase domain-containing protein [Propionibacteriaceae bacterium]|nr:lytic transglycosylase domain-containing protein [Propionibacteriaceae bacterium]
MRRSGLNRFLVTMLSIVVGASVSLAVVRGSDAALAAPGTPITAPEGATAPRADLDVAGLLAQRTAQLVRRTTAITVHNAALEAIEQARIAELGYDPALTDPRDIARSMMLTKYGWGDAQFACYDHIIMRESRWIVTADNPHSSAYGIPQALPGSKMASAGADWRTNAATQIRWGLGYVKARFGTPCSAWSFKAAHGWY